MQNIQGLVANELVARVQDRFACFTGTLYRPDGSFYLIRSPKIVLVTKTEIICVGGIPKNFKEA
jgi:hypothetical protein